MTRQGGGEAGGEACRPRPEDTEESFVASSGRSFFLFFWTQIGDEDGEGNREIQCNAARRAAPLLES